MKAPDGTYMDVVFGSSTNKLFDKIIKEFGLEKDFKDDYHCTIIYSKKYLPYLKTSKGDKQVEAKANSKINKLVKIKDFGHFKTPEGKNLHIVLDCPYCKTEFARTIKAGATTDYPEYVAHVTLMYNCKDFDLDFKKNKDLTKKFIGQKVEIVEERISPLNTNWVEDSKKKDND